jgi:hypothetical protein
VVGLVLDRAGERRDPYTTVSRIRIILESASPGGVVVVLGTIPEGPGRYHPHHLTAAEEL